MAVFGDWALEDGIGLAQKKVWDQPLELRKHWVGASEPLALTRQCELTGVARSSVYAPVLAAPPDAQELTLLGLIDAQYTRHPFYGSRKLRIYLRGAGHSINRKRVQRLNIRLAHGFVYLVAVIDWYACKVLAWRLSNTLDSGFCVDCLEQALRAYGAPEIFNTDQGCQFTSGAFTGVLKEAGIAISMDGRGRALDNIFVERLWRSVKHEDVYLKGYATLPDLLLGLTAYFVFYNSERTPKRWVTAHRMRFTGPHAVAVHGSWTNSVRQKNSLLD